MNDPRRPEWSDPTQAAANGYPPNTDPAYSGPYYGPPYYGQGYVPPMTNPTEQLPTYWQPGGGYPPTQPPQAPPPPEPPRSPRWLWIAAAVAVLLVVGLVIALVIVMGSSKESTVVAPLPSMSPSSTTVPRPTTTTRVPTRTTTVPSPTTTGPATPTVPGETPSPTGTDTVVYNVSGDGRAINITYVDTGGVMQTEFNVMLPWSKEVSLASPAKSSASVAIVNVGRDVSCSVSVNGVQVAQRTGRGLTICTGAV